jgi:hypothetical protein
MYLYRKTLESAGIVCGCILKIRFSSYFNPEFEDNDSLNVEVLPGYFGKNVTLVVQIIFL